MEEKLKLAGGAELDRVGVIGAVVGDEADGVGMIEEVVGFDAGLEAEVFLFPVDFLEDAGVE